MIEQPFRSRPKRPVCALVREDLTSEPLRFWAVGSYVVIYLEDSQPLQVLRVIHGARDVQAILEEASAA
jgi:antitoxin ParD1/3/4/toxin ParE1/3/4